MNSYYFTGNLVDQAREKGMLPMVFTELSAASEI